MHQDMRGLPRRPDGRLGSSTTLSSVAYFLATSTRAQGVIYAADLPIIWFTDAERLARINATYEADGFTVYDAHVNVIEGNHMQPDYRHLAWKKRLDPKGLLNPGKSLEWERVKHLSADQIEALGPDQTPA